ncbi:hypothetical protein B7494_g2608 [Chlorociboria aeruginascens]|nr:hypothetical protein B7494_g2608 [Chlorociboria aeruginascens]
MRQRSVVSSFIWKPEADGGFKVAVFKRSQDVSTYRGKWAACSGSIDPNDASPFSAAIREIHEETGLQIDTDITLLRRGMPFSLPAPELDTEWTIHPFAFQLTPQAREIKIDWEHTEYRFITPEEFQTYETVPDLYLGLKRVLVGKETEENLRTLRDDHENGAQAMSLIALEMLRKTVSGVDLSGGNGTEEFWNEIRMVAWHLAKNGRPSMSAAIEGTLFKVLDEVKVGLENRGGGRIKKGMEMFNSQSLRTMMEEIIDEEKTARIRSSDRLATHFVDFISSQTRHQGGNSSITIVTLSASGTISSCLKQLILSSAATTKINLRILESRPLFEGISFTATLLSSLSSLSGLDPQTRQNLKVEILTDASMASAVQSADYLILGADKVSPTSSICNKIGSLPAVVLAKTLNPACKVIALFKTDKIVALGNEAEHLQIEHNDKEEVIGAWAPELRKGLEAMRDEGWHVEVRNPYFEWVDQRYIDVCISEEGLMGDDDIKGFCVRSGKLEERVFGDLSNTIRSSNGCWTCRLRRKKCDGFVRDEQHPVCDACAALHITCYYDAEKPDWMDGGTRQKEMAERLKGEVKENAHRRAVHISGDRVSITAATAAGELLQQLPSGSSDLSTPDIPNLGMKPCPEASTIRLQRGADCTLTSKKVRESISFGRSDTILLMFYLEHLLPFLFPFYRPSLLQGGRAWVLEMMISSPVVRQATLCQSSYFFSLARGMANGDEVWDTVLTQTREAFEVLRQSLQVIDGSSITEHLHGAVRIMASIMQVQRFEIAVLSFKNCQAHLNAALALFRQLLDSADESVGPISSFNSIVSRLGPPSWILPVQSVQVPSAEQAAFRFSSTLLVLDDIIASTVLQEQPKLYEYHPSLLGSVDDADPTINLEAVVGCQNWALLQVGEIAVLDAWKQRCKRAGNLDVMELVHRATPIKESLEAHLTQLETDLVMIPKEDINLLDVFTADYCQQSKSPTSQSSLVTRVWAHAALVYLLVVVSGLQPSSVDIHYHVGRIVELLMHHISPPALLRTMVWPFFVAGCLAEPAQETHFRGMVEVLQPPSVFGTVRKALEIMEIQGDLVLLV